MGPGGAGGAGGEAGEATGGATTGGSNSGGSGALPDSGVSGTGGTGGTTGEPGGEGGEAISDRNAKDIESDSSCGCRVPGDSRRSDLPALLALALGAAVLRRRRRPTLN
jgi:MYXO-CTERM domain-containing protein